MESHRGLCARFHTLDMRSEISLQHFLHCSPLHHWSPHHSGSNAVRTRRVNKEKRLLTNDGGSLSNESRHEAGTLQDGSALL